MKRTFILFILALCTASGRTATSRFEDGDSIKINKDFMRELDAAFSFVQPEVSDYKLIAPQPLTKELLHQWVGPVDQSSGSQISIPCLSGQELLKASYLWKKGQYGQLKDGTFTGLDVNALAKYIRPEEIKLRRMRKLASSVRGDMDLLFPKDGPAFVVKRDTTVAAVKKTGN